MNRQESRISCWYEEHRHLRCHFEGETVIPRPVREKLGLRPGDRLRYIETLDGIVIEKAWSMEDDPFATSPNWRATPTTERMLTSESRGSNPETS